MTGNSQRALERDHLVLEKIWHSVRADKQRRVTEADNDTQKQVRVRNDTRRENCIETIHN